MSYWKALLVNLLGFIGFLIVFVGVTFIAAQLNTNCGPFGMLLCGDAVQRVGFPFVFLEIGGLIPPGTYTPDVSIPALLSDMCIAILGSAVVGVTCQCYFGRAQAARKSKKQIA